MSGINTRPLDWWPSDPATSYALSVLNWEGGKKPLVASDHVKAACERHLRDLDNGRWIWDPRRGDKFADFCHKMCMVFDPEKGVHVPFKLLPWQAFVAYSVLSWRAREKNTRDYLPGSRRYRQAFVLTAKGSGKSPFGAALGLFMMTGDRYIPIVNGADGPPVKMDKPQCFVVASTVEQADKVGLSPAETMMESSDQLRSDMSLRKIESSKRIVSSVMGSYMRAVGAQGTRGGLAGLNPHYIQWEEMHEQTDREAIDKLLMGVKGRPQPLMLMLTNAGMSKQSMAYEEYERAQQAVLGGKDLDTYFSYIAECTDDDIPDSHWFPRESAWVKANPSLGVTIRKDVIKDVIGRAKSEQAKAEAKQLYASMWSETNDEFVSQEMWDRVETPKLDPEKLEGARLFVGIDPALRDDMCAVAYLWWCVDKKWRLRVRHYSPAEGYEERARACSGHLLDWRKADWLTVPGGGMIDLRLLARDIKGVLADYNCDHVVVDSYRFLELRASFEAEGIPFWIAGQPENSTSWEGADGMNVELIMHSQTYMKRQRHDDRDLWMEGSINNLKAMILGLGDDDPSIEIEFNPVLKWNRASAVVAFDTQMNRRFDKKTTRSRMQGKIDGLVAATMVAGLGTLEVARGAYVSPFEDPNFRWDD